MTLLVRSKGGDGPLISYISDTEQSRARGPHALRPTWGCPAVERVELVVDDHDAGSQLFMGSGARGSVGTSVWWQSASDTPTSVGGCWQLPAPF